MALLGIALANITTAWIMNDGDGPDAYFGGVETLADKIYVVFAAMFVHVRGLPMFSTLLGFGVGLIAMSLWRRGFPLGRARAVIAKRYGFLTLFGALHCLFLFMGDIMMLYGAIGILIALLLSVTDKTLMRVAYVLFGFQVVAGIGIGVAVAFIDTSDFNIGSVPSAESYVGLLGEQAVALLAHAVSFPFTGVVALPVMLVGFVWARRGTLAGGHKRELWAWTVLALAIILFLGLPWGLSTIGVLDPALAEPLNAANSFIGMLTGPGIVAAATLALEPLQRRGARPWFLWPLIALGKRSMTGYVLQSVFFLALVYPFTLNIGPEFSATGQAALAAGVWLATLLIACALEAAGKPGPFEWVHRRLSYGKTMRPELGAAPNRGPSAPAHPPAAPGLPSGPPTGPQPGAFPQPFPQQGAAPHAFPPPSQPRRPEEG
ncbi:membrane protein [Corynebacterium minutissimum]|nr:membrane protein [Corynebacterium minutissimum]